ncbi:MAG: 16S rRNA (guanine(966)-N(2))-methyltransferase RsmD [Firmicutes bacterium]|nr:16S rRNA (guanine(966)-N(2))-methyltransferase RsmD [Bacillota bacterium]
MGRVIAGLYKGRRLFTPEGMDTRPTTDRLKEALFGMLQFDLMGKSFLDLFSGSGQMGIEALSRGASSADLVEMDRRALSCIRKNLTSLQLTDKARVWPLDVRRAISRFETEGRQFDWIFMDPPYLKGLEDEIGSLIAGAGILAPEGTLVIESSSETVPCIDGLEKVREKVYKTTRFSFFVRKE